MTEARKSVTHLCRASETIRPQTGLDVGDIRLWSISALVALFLAAGVAAVVIPNVTWGASLLRIDARYLPHLLLTFVVLILVFNLTYAHFGDLTSAWI